VSTGESGGDYCGCPESSGGDSRVDSHCFWLAVIELLWRYTQSAVGTADAFGGVESALSWLTLSDVGS
jgi:hypothetical protein